MRLLAAFALCIAAFGAPVRIREILYSADGKTRATGQIEISWQAFTAADGKETPAGKITRSITAGVLDIELQPNSNSTPPSYYQVRLQLDGLVSSTQLWIVPPSSTALSVADLRVVTPPPSTVYIKPSQIARQANSAGKVLCDTGGGVAYCDAATQVPYYVNPLPAVGSTTLTITGAEHQLGTRYLSIGDCVNENGSPIDPGPLSINTTTFDVSISFGTAVVRASCRVSAGPHYVFPLDGTLTNFTISAVQHRMKTIRSVSCYTPANERFTPGLVAFTDNAVEIGDEIVSARDVSVFFGTSTPPGMCILFGS